ncbi:Transposase [Shigella dysenteriae 1617]|uniref:Transposase n=1 Tax=Shigella dysenteriae 1617 TaxID=754093 RepID=A0A0A6ZPF8_SHIDY|nr:Transposase [Shigella dysenteriae 1617]
MTSSSLRGNGRTVVELHDKVIGHYLNIKHYQ